MAEMLQSHLVKGFVHDITDSRSYPKGYGKSSKGFKKNHKVLTPSGFAKGLCCQLFILSEDTYSVLDLNQNPSQAQRRKLPGTDKVGCTQKEANIK